MAIISTIGRKHWKVRLLISAIFITLIVGAVTMVYPFLLMLAGSSKSGTDRAEWRVLPCFLTSEEALYAKHVEGFFNEYLTIMKVTYNLDIPSFKKLQLPTRPNKRLVEAWQRFLTETPLPHYFFTIGYLDCHISRETIPHLKRAFKDLLKERFHDDIDSLNKAMGTEFVGWNAFRVQPEDYLMRRNNPGTDAFDLELQRFKANQPLGCRYYYSIEGLYKTIFLKTQYTHDIVEYNREHGTTHVSYDDVHLDSRLPTGPGRTQKERDDWEQFVRTIVNLLWLRADPSALPFFQKFLVAKYQDIRTLNRNYGTEYNSFSEAPLIIEPPETGLALSDWDAFVQGWKDPETGEMHILPADTISIYSVDFMFRDYLKRQYGSIEKINTGLGTSFRNWQDIFPPQRDAHYFAFKEQIGSLRREFLVRNYLTVIDHMVLHGRGILNTTIYCLLAILAALIVNPLAAYALSRYKPPSSYKILLLLMLTMAFPPMVTRIPVFLMLRDFKMLNTFWALILPGLANGYSIFLLKGFFDSLPRELYESAELDGAGEFRIFWQFTICLSKPILAVITLNAFTHAYSNFMFALLICQDRSMWTLMVWLYQLQSRSGPGVIYASLIIAAIPTFIVFTLCQNIIMRGIVVPVEK